MSKSTLHVLLLSTSVRENLLLFMCRCHGSLVLLSAMVVNSQQVNTEFKSSDV